MISDFLSDNLCNEEIVSIVKHYTKANRILEKVDLKKWEWIIFPYGSNGKIVENILKEKNIIPVYIIDNEVCKADENIYSIEILKNISIDNYKIILTSDRSDIYEEIRNQLSLYVAMNNILDIFSPSLYYDIDAYYDNFYFDTKETQSPRRNALELASKEIYKNGVTGAIAEVGVYQGNFANSMARVFPERKFYLFDTFEGFDNRDVDEREENWSSHFRFLADHKDTSVELVLSNISYTERAIIKKGYFPETAIGLENERFAFVSLDTDLYKPIIEGLKFFWPRISPGGYIFVDDLGHRMLQGVREAVLDFCKENHVGYVSIDDGLDATAVLSKPL